MRVVITGAAGFIGSRFAELLLEQAERLGYDDVVVLDALTYSGRRENMDALLRDSRVSFVKGSIVDEEVTNEVLRGAHAVVHFAAESHVDRSITGARPFFETNVLGTMQLLESARLHGVERFVHVSTDEVYGSIPEGSWREDHILEPNSPYSSSKAGSDLAALAYHRTFGLGVSVTRCSNNYGPRQFPEKVIPLFVTNLVDGAKVPTQRLLALCGADESMIEPVADRLGHDRRYSVDWTKIHDELGYEPQVPFETGLAETVRWYHDNESWWRPLKDAP